MISREGVVEFLNKDIARHEKEIRDCKNLIEVINRLAQNDLEVLCPPMCLSIYEQKDEPDRKPSIVRG